MNNKHLNNLSIDNLSEVVNLSTQIRIRANCAKRKSN